MSNNLNDIVDIQIQIASPATSLSGFESILIVGPEPTSKTLEDYKTLGVYTSLESGLLSARQELMRKSMRISPSGQRRMKRWPALLSPRPRAAWPLIPT